MCQSLFHAVSAYDTLMMDKQQTVCCKERTNFEFAVIINQLVCSLEKTIDARVCEVFKIVIDFNDIDADQIREYAISMANTFSGDLQSGELA